MTEQLKVTSELIDSLYPWDENPRDITQDAFEGLCESLKTFGMPEPLVANTVNRRIIGGHQRWGAAKKLGWLYVPVAWVTIEDPLQEEALNVTLNNPKIQGVYNQDKLQSLLERFKVSLSPIKFEALKLSPLQLPNNWNTGTEQVEKTEANNDGILATIKLLVPMEQKQELVTFLKDAIAREDKYLGVTFG